ncbi:hypothetical protein CDL12_05841 [Handroanthus impetiginosus]|uniref:RNase H type-1 domain-containing protein n=1 Tax=Handroanthus impetiginosus TaxID=429701 RepID=A0A2G9HVB2_9LAMI|nr:hypothetical protein CDL12_05841 [Handroanthus impetiginosus]
MWLVLREISWADSNKLLLWETKNRGQVVILARWRPPQAKVVEVNTDAATFKDLNTIRLGVVARDSSGACVAWRTKLLEVNVDTECVKAMAIRLAVELCGELLWMNVETECDNINVVSALNRDGHKELSICDRYCKTSED